MKNNEIHILREKIDTTYKSLGKLSADANAVLVLSLDNNNLCNESFGLPHYSSDKLDVFKHGNTFLYDFQKLNNNSNSNFGTIELSCYTQKLIESYQQVKILLTISEKSFADKAEKFLEFLDFFGQMFNNKAASKNFVFVISDATADNGQDLANFLTSNFPENNLANHQNQLLKAFVDRAQ